MSSEDMLPFTVLLGKIKKIYVPEEIAAKSIALHGDIAATLKFLKNEK